MSIELRLATLRFEGNACTLATFEFSDNSAADGNALATQSMSNIQNAAGIAAYGSQAAWEAEIARDPIPPVDDPNG